MAQLGKATKLTPTYLLNKVKRRLGIKTFILPMDDDELLEILYEDTLPLYSIYFPRSATIKMDLKNCQRAQNKVIDNDSFGKKAYHLDLSNYGDLSIIDIEGIQTAYNNINAFELDGYSHGSAYDMFMDAFQQATIESMVCTQPTFIFEAPDILILDEPGYSFGSVVSIDFLLEHAKDLSTIKMTYIEQLSKLYRYDIQLALYPILKHMDKIETTFGTIDLKIDDWTDAESNRHELIDYWSEHFLAHRKKTIFRQ